MDKLYSPDLRSSAMVGCGTGRAERKAWTVVDLLETIYQAREDGCRCRS